MKKACPLSAAFITLLVFLPAFHLGFINLDDPLNILKNPHLGDFGWRNLSWMFSTFHGSHYQPLTWLSFALDHALWGLTPEGYHATSVVLHAANAGLFCILAAKLIAVAESSKPDAASWLGGLFAALLFALHPLRVESVAWASERGDALSCFLYLVAILLFLRNDHGLSFAAFALSLLSKSIAVTLPITLLLLDIYPLKNLPADPRHWKLSSPFIRQKLPFFALAFADGLLALYGQKTSGAMSALASYGPLDRLSQAAYGLSFYVVRTFWPFQLSAIYELPAHFDAFAPLYLSAAAFVALITAALWRLRRRAPGALAAWVFYVITLLPVLGIFQSGPQIAADRYSYLACASFAIFTGGLLSRRLRTLDGRARGWLAGAAVLQIALAVLTVYQENVWADSETLWRHALKSQPDSTWARVWLAGALSDSGKKLESFRYYRQALDLRPDMAAAHYGLGVTYERLHKTASAITEYAAAAGLDPSDEAAHYNLATLTKDPEQARSHYEAALRLDPDDADASYNYGNLLMAMHDASGAIAAFQSALRVRPGDPRIENNLGTVLAGVGRLGDAEAAYRTGLAREPNDVELLGNLGLALSGKGEFAAAIAVYQKSLSLAPDNAVTHNNLGIALAESGHIPEAAAQFKAALALQPDYADARFNLSRLDGRR